MRAELDLAKVEFKRMEELVGKGAVSQAEFDQKKSAIAVWQAKLAGSEVERQEAMRCGVGEKDLFAE